MKMNMTHRASHRHRPGGGDGEVIGIPALAAGSRDGSQAQGIGFAIPSNLARDIAQQITTAEKVTNSHRAAIGAQLGTVVGRDDAPTGAGVVSITDGGPADRAGLRPGDIIQAAGGTATPDTQAVAGVLATAHPGDQLALSVARGTQELAMTVTLGELPGT